MPVVDFAVPVVYCSYRKGGEIRMSNNRNRKVAIIALIAVVVLSLVAVFLMIHLIRELDFSSVKMPVWPRSESTAPSEPQSTFNLTPPTEPVPPPKPSSVPGIFSKPAPVPLSTPDPLSAFDSVSFGTYMDHPIEWIVLDRQDDRLLLLCKRALETLPYHDTEDPVTWESCSLRAWLNGAFLSSAFTADEAARILLTEVDNSCVNPEYKYTKGSAPTEDKVFLLSHDEAAQLLPEEAVRLCEKALHAPSYDNAISSWWLRSPGLYPNCAEYVYRTGAFFSGTANRMFVDVRPAMWIESP